MKLKNITKKTICVNCKHHLQIISNKNCPDVWYHHFCKAAKLPKMVNPVTGKESYVDTNDIGVTVYTRSQYQYCRNVNTGYCTLYEE